MSDWNSKYNHKESIPLDSIPKKELDQAIKEWSQGSKNMEKLIRKSIANGIETNGCHPWAGPYLDFIFNKNLDAEYKLISSALECEGAQMLFCPDGGNPLSGDNWDKPVVLVGSNSLKTEGEVTSFLDHLSDSFDKEGESNPFYNNLLSLMDWLVGKESRIKIRVTNNNDKYTMIFEFNFLNDDIVDYYKNFFNKTKLIRNNSFPEEINSYELSNSNQGVLNQALLEIKELFKNDFVSPKSNFEEKGNMYVRNVRKTFGDTEEGISLFNNWFEKYKKEERHIKR